MYLPPRAICWIPCPSPMQAAILWMLKTTLSLCPLLLSQSPQLLLFATTRMADMKLLPTTVMVPTMRPIPAVALPLPRGTPAARLPVRNRQSVSTAVQATVRLMLTIGQTKTASVPTAARYVPTKSTPTVFVTNAVMLVLTIATPTASALSAMPTSLLN